MIRCGESRGQGAPCGRGASPGGDAFENASRSRWLVCWERGSIVASLLEVAHICPRSTWFATAAPRRVSVSMPTRAWTTSVVEQAERAAETLADAIAMPVPIYSSPLARARQTAAPLAARWGVDVAIESRVAEIPSPTDDLRERARWLAGVMAGRWMDLPAEVLDLATGHCRLPAWFRYRRRGVLPLHRHQCGRGRGHRALRP